MRVEQHSNSDGRKVWMEPSEVQTLIDEAESLRDSVAIRLMSEAGLRSHEVVEVTPDDLRPGEHGRHYWLTVAGKDTTEGSGRTERDAYVPSDLGSLLRTYESESGLDPDDRYVPTTTRTVRNIVQRAAEGAAETTGNDRYPHVTPHDLRRFFAHDLLVRQRVGVRVVMAIGGWSDYSSIEPYLTVPTPENVAEEMNRAQGGGRREQIPGTTPTRHR